MTGQLNDHAMRAIAPDNLTHHDVHSALMPVHAPIWAAGLARSMSSCYHLADCATAAVTVCHHNLTAWLSQQLQPGVISGDVSDTITGSLGSCKHWLPLVAPLIGQRLCRGDNQFSSSLDANWHALLVAEPNVAQCCAERQLMRVLMAFLGRARSDIVNIVSSGG